MLRRCLRKPALSQLPALFTRLAGYAPKTEQLPDRPRAAVSIILVPDPDSVLLIRRAQREGDRWSGQLAFPGGRWSPGDADLAHTARRETQEEVGLDLLSVPVVTALDDLAPRTPVLPPIIVRPFVFSLPQTVVLHPNHEVAGAWWVPLESLRRPGAYGPVELESYGTLLRTMGYDLEIGTLWGMTERILTPLLGLLPELR